MNGICKQCGKEAIFVREAVYEGFTKVGEQEKCSLCGYTEMVQPVVEEASSPAPGFELPSIFDESDRSVDIQLFDEGENRQICRYCVSYIVNPFTQRCVKHQREVDATDTCSEFSCRVPA